MASRKKLTAPNPPIPLYERAARIWLRDIDTLDIARDLRVREAVIYNAMQTIRDIADDFRHEVYDSGGAHKHG